MRIESSMPFKFKWSQQVEGGPIKFLKHGPNGSKDNKERESEEDENKVNALEKKEKKKLGTASS